MKLRGVLRALHGALANSAREPCSGSRLLEQIRHGTKLRSAAQPKPGTVTVRPAFRPRLVMVTGRHPLRRVVQGAEYTRPDARSATVQ